MRSYYHKLLPNHIDEYFIPISSIHCYSTSLATSNNLFLPEATPPQDNIPLRLLAQKYGLQYQTI